MRNAVLGLIMLVASPGLAVAQFGPDPGVDGEQRRLARDWYLAYLGREPSFREYNTVLSLLQQGQSPVLVQARLASSDEYFLRNGGTTEGYIAAMVRDVRNVPPNPAVVRPLIRYVDTVGRFRFAAEFIGAASTGQPFIPGGGPVGF